MDSVAVASSSQMAADAGVEVARAGGNAVDAAVAATLASLATETAVASLGGGGFVTVCTPDGRTRTIDGYVEMPGRGVPEERIGEGTRTVRLSYGGGVSTTVGPGSVATPGTLAALDRVWRDHGSLPWARLVEPALRLVEEGFPLTPSAHHYLVHSHEPIFAWHPETRRVLSDGDGRLLDAGETVRIPGLARTLARIAEEGARIFYDGELGERIVEHLRESGGILSMEDLRAYRPEVREPLEADVDGWRVATNPPPAVGGAVLIAMLLLMGDHPRGGMEGRPNEGTGDGPRAGWSAEGLERLVRVQETVLDFRSRELDRSDDLAAAVRRFLDEPVQASLRRIVDSRSTIHTSAVDGDGRACSISASTGYGSGVIAPGTGIFLNNCLGEHELCPDGPGSHPVGARLPSNMAPTVARSRGGDVLAVGSPGSDRITTALLQTLLNHLKLGMSLEDAVAHPRLHVETGGDRPRVAHEPGLALEGLGMETRSFDGPSMFFGGVAACRWSRDGGFSVASDPRRAGGAAVHRAGEAAPAEAPSGD